MQEAQINVIGCDFAHEIGSSARHCEENKRVKRKEETRNTERDT